MNASKDHDMRSEREKKFQRQLIEHLEKRATDGAPSAARMLEMALAKLARDEASERESA